MKEIKVAENKTLKLTNVLSREIHPEEMASLPVVLTQSGATTVATGTVPLKRLAFKIGENEWADTSMVADDVQVKFKLALTGVGKL